jgi:hypothetical protein|tara:strand:- start:182 stop:397 length:216 start_codon:yes stop_codon:yes gene_type:complete
MSHRLFRPDNKGKQMRYKFTIPKEKTQRPPSKLNEQLERNYADRKGLDTKPSNEPLLSEAFDKLVKDPARG